MDPIKKLVSARLEARTEGPHPDAEVLSAFAEKALSSAERYRVLDHLGKCADCRATLFLALPDAAEAQKVLQLTKPRFSGFALRWGTLAAVVAAGAVLFVGVRHRSAPSGTQALSAQKTISAELKTPAEVAEMHALRDDRASGTPKELSGAERDKLIPTPKHMTAKPTAQFSFDQDGQVRLAPSSRATAINSLPVNGRSFNEFKKLDSSTAPSAPVAGGVAGVPAQNYGGPVQTGTAARAVTGQGQGAADKIAQVQANLGGVIVDPQGAVIANATVTTVGPVGTRAIQSDAQGRFSFDRLAPGSYSVKAEAPGFTAAEFQQVAVQANQEANLRMILQVGSASETVQVAASQMQPEQSANEATSGAKTQAAAAPAATTESVVQLEAEQNQKQAKNKAVREQNPTAYHDLVAKTLAVQPQFTLAPNGSVQRSLDLGRTWQTVSIRHARKFRALSSAGSDVWAGGNAGVLFHSSDSGQSWARVVPSTAGRKLVADITHVDFSDSLNGAVTAANGEVWTTSDGGQSWTVR